MSFYQKRLICLFRILQEENRQLKMALDEHQVTLDVIMQRYRQQVVEMIKLNKLQQMADKAVHGINVSYLLVISRV